jgi:hypothetical protein
MKDWLLMVAVAGAGFVGTLGVTAVRGKLSHPTAVSMQAMVVVPPAPQPAPAPAPTQTPTQTPTPAPASDAAIALQSAPEPAAADPQPDGRDSDESIPAPNYDEQAAARDRAAAHSARSR